MVARVHCLAAMRDHKVAHLASCRGGVTVTTQSIENGALTSSRVSVSLDT